MMAIDDTPASPEAISICAPYGSIPCIIQENVSKILAVLRGSSPNLVVMSLAMRPVVSIAMVLLAVHIFAMLTIAAMLNSAPLFPLILRVSNCTI